MFRLRLSNNRLEDVNSTNLASLTHANKLKINRNSPPAKLSTTNPTNQYGASRHSSFYLNAMSKANSMCATPTELTLPVIMNSKKKSRKSSKSSLVLSATKKSSVTVKADSLQEPNSNINNPTTTSNSISNNNYNISNTSYDNCNCVLCNSNSKKSNNYKNIFSFNSNDMYIVDSKNFINCLNRMKPTIKLDRDSNFSELGYLGSSSQTSTEFNNNTNNNSTSNNNINHPNVNTLIKIKNNNETIKLLPASSRIKLWEPDEVSNYINTEDAKNALSNRTTASTASESLKKSTRSKETLEQSKPEVESRLNKIFKQFRLNPNLSPLIYKANHSSSATISFQQVLNSPSTLNKQVMPVLSKAPTSLMYRVPMNSALNFYDC